jgi:hypothetical protein
MSNSSNPSENCIWLFSYMPPARIFKHMHLDFTVCKENLLKPELKTLVLCLCVSAHTWRLHAKLKKDKVQRTKCHEVTELVQRYSPRWSLPCPCCFTTWKSLITHIQGGWVGLREGGRGCRQVLKISSQLGFESKPWLHNPDCIHKILIQCYSYKKILCIIARSVKVKDKPIKLRTITHNKVKDKPIKLHTITHNRLDMDLSSVILTVQIKYRQTPPTSAMES